jgi:hypothetical protein
MAELEYIPLELNEIPTRKQITLDGTELELEFEYNEVGDFYTLLVRSIETGSTIYTTKLVYGVEANHFAVEGFPYNIKIIPASIDDLISTEIQEIPFNQANFSKIKLYIGRVL